MKRFLPEISLGLATAAEILWLWNWASDEPGLRLHLHLVACIGLCAWRVSYMRRLDEPGREHTLKEAREAYKEAGRQSRQQASQSSDQAVRALAMQGREIEAIKMHRELHGGGLREALDHVKSLRSGPIGY